MTKPEGQRLDCFRLLTEMHRAGVNNTEVARRLGVPRSTVNRWKQGAEPGFTTGKRLIDLHTSIVTQTVETVE